MRLAFQNLGYQKNVLCFQLKPSNVIVDIMNLVMIAAIKHSLTLVHSSVNSMYVVAEPHRILVEGEEQLYHLDTKFQMSGPIVLSVIKYNEVF